MIFPWQHEQWQQLLRCKQANRLPHALIFAGSAGTGKARFAENFSRALLCTSASNHSLLSAQAGEDDLERICTDTTSRKMADGDLCHSCRLIQGRAHPNVVWVEPEEEGKAIKVDQIREVNEFIQQSSLQGEYRVVIINPANAMNISAANALLKTLEEPSAGAVIILITHQSDRLPATIRSRCQRVTFPVPSKDQALQWIKAEMRDYDGDHELLLNLANGAPLSAVKLVESEALVLRKTLFDSLWELQNGQGDPIKAAAQLQDAELQQILDFSLTWLLDVMRLQLGSDASEIINKDYTQQLSDLSLRVQTKQVTQFMDYVLQLRGQLSLGINLNKQLSVESLLIRWMNE